MYKFKEFHIPNHMLESLEAYVETHRGVGSFLAAVIRNDLADAVARADDENLPNLPAYIGWLYNKAPMSCWGSPEK